MRKFRLSSVLAMLLSALLLITSLPMAAFAVTPSIGIGAGTPNYDKFRGNGMTADANGVMVYDDLAAYKKTSRKDQALSVSYQTVKGNATNSGTTTSVATYDECSVLYADYAIYYDDTIEGNTVKIRYGLSMMDSVEYIDANGNIVKGDKSPIELSGSYKNNANPDWNAGYGMVYNETTGELEYTTRYYEEKAILFYIINHSVSERIGQEDDVSILQDYIDQGYVIVTLDFKSHANATNPYIEQALISAQSTFKSCAEGTVLGNLGVTTSAQFIYCLPEGCRIERDVWYWDTSIWGAEGTMDAYRNKWNQKISYESTYTLDDGTQPTFPDYYKVGNLETVEEMLAEVGQYVDKTGYSDEANGKPIEYKLSMNIIYPSQPKVDYEVPVYVQEGTGYTREDGVGTGYTRGTFISFALNGYACAQYDHGYWPFLYRWGYQFYNSGSDYTQGTNLPRNALTAMRCVRSLADELGYSRDLLGAGGISKATVGLSALSLKNNKNYPHGYVSFTDFLTGEKKTYSRGVFEGDIRDEKGTVVQTILQPFMYYDEAHTEEISSDSCVTYISSGEGYERLYKSLATYEKVPLLVSGGLRDQYNCYNYWDSSVEWFEANLTEPWLPLTQLDQGHAYPVGDDTQFGYNRGNAMIRYFDVFLKPDANRAPEVLWATPFNGASDVACSTKWTVGPFTPYGAANWAPDSYYYPQAIQIRFLDAVDPDSVNSGVTVTVTETGAKVDGTWVASQNDALYTFECDALTPGTRYTIDITSGVEGKNGVALAETRKIGFKTEGTYALSPVADAYVSSNAPDKVFGSANKLQVSNAYTTLVSYDTEHILDATKIQLKANGSVEDTVNVEIFALADYKVDEATLTYNTLKASEAWTNKVSLGKYTLVDGNISLDLYDALSAVEGLGDTVTLAFVSTDTLVSDVPYVFTNDFETPVKGTQHKVNDVEIIKASGTAVMHSSDAATAFSDFWWSATGSSKTATLVNSSTVPLLSGSNQAFGIRVRQGTETMKFLSTLSDDALTSDDIGKTYRLTVDVYTAQDVNLSVGLTVSKSITGGYNTYGVSEAKTQTVKKGTWTPVTYLFTVSEKTVTSQAIIGFVCNYQMDENRLVDTNGNDYQDFWTYFDNLVVEECTPMLTVDANEAGSTEGFTLITTNPGAPLNQPITVTFDEAMDLSTFKKGMVVTNEKTGERIKGTWAAADNTNTVFTFTTDGLMANTTYTVATTEKVKTAAGVACTEEIVKTVATEGSYSLRPLATSYVSVANATTHYGLNADPVLDADKLGVVTFSTKTLASAQIAKMYLGVDSAKNGAIRVYALNYTPDASLCYNSVKDSLIDANLLGLYEVDANGTVGIDLADVLKKSFGDAVTLVLKAGYVFTNDFETPRLGGTLYTDHVLEDGTVASYPAVYTGTQADLNGVSVPNTTIVTNSSYGYSGNAKNSPGFWWRGSGATQVAALVTDPTGANSTQVFRARLNYGANGIKLYNAFRVGEVLDAGDIGRTYAFSYEILTPQAVTISTAPVAETGYISAISSNSYNPTQITATANKWTTMSGTITLTSTFVANNYALFGVQTPNQQGDDTLTTYWQYFDNFVIEEVVTDPITVDKESLILMTENTETEDVTNADNPVEDELYPSVLNAPIEVSFNTAMDITTFEKGMVVTNTATGDRVDGTWSATDATNMNFAFTTKGFVAGATYTVATTAAVKTLGGTAVGSAVIKTVTMEGSYALKPLVTSYVSKSEPKQHFGLDTDLVLDTNKLGVVTFSTKTLAGAEDAFLYMPWNATRKTFIYVYALADYLPDSTLCYDSVKASLTDANLVLMDEWASGTYAIDLNALADRDLGENVTLVIKAGYTYFNDFEGPAAGTLASDGTHYIVKSNGQVVDPSTSWAFIENPNRPFSEYIWKAVGAAREGYFVKDDSIRAGSQLFRMRTSGGQNARFYNSLTPDFLTSEDVGREFNVSVDVYSVASYTMTYGVMCASAGDGTPESPTGSAHTLYYDGGATEITANKWHPISFSVELTDGTNGTKDMITPQAGLVSFGVPAVKDPSTGENLANFYTYFDDLLVEEVVSEFTLPADSFILVTENEASVDVTDANPVVDEIYEDDVVVPEPPVESVETKITAAEVALGTSITVHYYATLNEDHAGAQMRFTVDGVKTLVDGVKSGKEYVYSYTGIAPQGLGENIKAELIVDGEVVATKDEYSVLQNCKNLLAKTAAELGISDEKYAAMKTLIADLLEYGAAAQLYVNHKTDALVNEGNEGATAFVALGDEWSKMPTETTDATVDLISAGLHFNNTNKLYFRFEAADITADNFKVTIDGNEYTLGDFELTDNGYILRTEDIAATELDHLFTIELIKNGETVQTLEYGVFAYVYNMQNNTSEAMATLAKTLYNYGVSADVYALAE